MAPPWQRAPLTLVPRVRLSPRPPYPGNMPPKKPRPPQKPATAAKLRWWRVSILRNRSRELGSVQARDEKAAEAAAITEFKLDDEQRKRLVVQERD